MFPRRWMALMLLGLTLGCHSPAPQPTSAPTTAPCWQAALRAVDEEMQRYQTWLAQASDTNQRAAYRQALDYLADLRQRLQSLPPDTPPWEVTWAPIPGVEQGTYGRTPLPSAEPITLAQAWIEGPLPSQVRFPEQTRSGPFYIATGTQGEITLQPNQPYRLTLQPLMPETYPFPSYYVCILRAETLP